jgi:hypothetical protein
MPLRLGKSLRLYSVTISDPSNQNSHEQFVGFVSLAPMRLVREDFCGKAYRENSASEPALKVFAP